MNMVRMKDFANLLGFLSVLAIGLFSNQAANAGFVIDAQTWHSGTTVGGVTFLGDKKDKTYIGALNASSLATITGTPVNQLNLLLKQDASSGSPDTSSFLKDSLALDIFAKEGRKGKEDGYSDFTLVNKEFFPVMDLLSPLYLVVKNGAHDPNQYVVDLLKYKFNGSVWDGMSTIIGSNFWGDRGGEISHIAMWGSVATGDLDVDLDGDLGGNAVVPEPATVALFAFGLFCFACGPIRRRLQKGAVVGVAG
jgi:hypothetical protein